MIARDDDDDADVVGSLTGIVGLAGDDADVVGSLTDIVGLAGEDADGVGSKTRVDSIFTAAWNMVSSTFYIFVTC